MSVKAFLFKLKKHVNSHALKTPLKFVTGNQSADMDSVVSAISYSYLSHLNDDGNYYIPLINIPKKDLRLRLDIKNLLSAHSISLDLLYFIEDFESLIKAQEKAHVVLVDHCNVQGELMTRLYGEKKIEVIGIIDHHEDEKVALDASPRIIKPNGSCSSLVFNYWYSRIENKEQFRGNEIINLLLAPLLIDTSNMTQKVESADTEALGRYKEYWTEDNAYRAVKSGSRAKTFEEQMEIFFSRLKKDKKNIKGFSVSDILYKDSKQFKFGPENVNVLFSSIGKSFYWLFKHYRISKIKSGIESVLKETNADAVIITPSFKNKETGAFTRELGLAFHADNAKAHIIEHLIPNVKTDLLLDDHVYKPKKVSSTLKKLNSKNLKLEVKNQANLKASRKQIVPAVKNMFDEYKAKSN